MEFLVQSRTYNTYGGSAIFSFVGDLLMVRLGDYGDAVRTIEITAYLRSPTRNPKPTLEELFDQYHDWLKKLPTITFRRRLRRVEIGYLSTHLNAADNDGWHPSIEKSCVAAGEIAQVLPLLKRRIKPEDDFDIERFLADASRVLSDKPASLEEWEAIREEAKRRRQALHAAKSPWEQLEIDWKQYHPRAREILDDPFFWENANDLAPNGNDTGADLLADYRSWDKRNANTSPLKFLGRLLKSWDIEPIDWSITEEKAVRKIDQEQPISLRVCNEAAIALAFAVLKMRASCPSDLAGMAMGALDRTKLLVMASSLSDEIKADWDVAIRKMTSKLKLLTR